MNKNWIYIILSFVGVALTAVIVYQNKKKNQTDISKQMETVRAAKAAKKRTYDRETEILDSSTETLN